MSRMNDARPPGGPGSRALRATTPQLLPAAVYSATERLEQIKDHQWSFVDDVAQNWLGWLGSFLFHGLIGLILGLIVWFDPMEVQGVIISAEDEEEDVLEEDVDDLLEPSPVITDIDEPPQVDADREDAEVGYNEDMDQGAPDWITSGGHLRGYGAGGGGGLGPARGWGSYIGGLQKSGLDIVFVFDSTGSMGGIILEVKTRIRQLMKVVKYLVPNARLGLVTYRDRPKYDLDDFEYTVKFIKLTKGTTEGMQKLSKFLRETEAYGGGDIPEAVLDGVSTAINKSGWSTKAKKIIIVFGDAPPRPEANGLTKMNNACASWHKRTKGVISCIDTTGGSKLLSEFKSMAENGGGESSFLNDERAIIKQLVVLIFGKKWKKEIDGVYDSVMREPSAVITETD